MPFFDKPAQLIGLHFDKQSKLVFIVASLTQTLNLVHTVICAPDQLRIALDECHKMFKQAQKVYPSKCFVFCDFEIESKLRAKINAPERAQGEFCSPELTLCQVTKESLVRFGAIHHRESLQKPKKGAYLQLDEHQFVLFTEDQYTRV